MGDWKIRRCRRRDKEVELHTQRGGRPEVEVEVEAGVGESRDLRCGCGEAKRNQRFWIIMQDY